MKNKYFKKILITTFGILIVFIIAIGCSTNKYLNTPTHFTNKKRFQTTNTTEVIILGTLHKNTKNVTFDSLYNTLERIKPNIILFENDSTAFNSKMELKNTIFTIVLPKFLSKHQPANLEEIASKKYQNFNPSTIIRPYEWNNRNLFHKKKEYVAITTNFFTEINNLYNLKKLNSRHDSIYKSFLFLTEQLNKYSDSTLIQINTRKVDSLAKKRQFFHYLELKKIADENETVKSYKEYYKVYSPYWKIRNENMAENICNYIKLYPNSRIVVLNGYFHRYFLIEELKKKQLELNFRIIEPNDIN